MGVEEASTEVGDVVVNGTMSPEKVEKVLTNNEDQADVKAIVEDNNNEGKVYAKEEADAEKMDEYKDEAEKENEPKEKEEEVKEAKDESIEEEKGSGEVKQEEDKKDEKGDVSEEKMDDVEESKEKMDDVEESKEKMDDVEESKEKTDDVEGSKGKADDVEGSKGKADDVEESKGKADDVEESKEKPGDVEESNGKTDDVEESKEKPGDVEESNGKTEYVEESKEKTDDVEKSKEEMDGVEESKEEMNGVKEKQEEKGSKKRKRGKSALEKSEAEEKEQEPKTPTITNRPVRERKSVERLVAVIEKDMYKDFHVEKGQGTRLKDIPNVAYKLSRRKGEDTFKYLHTILFGRRGKASEVKSNISRFSGFVWRDDEEKQKLKVKEKLDKCVKEKLLEICDVLDIPIAKSSTKKDDIVAKLIDFLVAPHATTTVLLSEKEQSSKGKKRGRDGSASRSLGTSPRRPVKSRKRSNDSKKEADKRTSDTEGGSEEEEEETDNGAPERSEDENSEQPESKEKNDASEESEEDTVKAKKGSKRNSAKKYFAGKGKTQEIITPKRSRSASKVKGTPKRSSSNPPKVSHDADTSPKVFSRKKKNDQGNEEKAPVSKRSASREKSGKRVVKGSAKPKDDQTKPSDDEMRNAVSEMLKQVDFTTATFKDILKQLSTRFNADLTSRKAAIKLMLQDELTKLADEAEDEEGEGDGDDAEKEEEKPAEQGVVA